ncbi:MAG: hypothetical protein ACLFXM_06625 [Acidimicrobiia bacterium]
MASTRPVVRAALVLAPVVIAAAVGCSSTSDGDRVESGTTSTTAVEDVVVEADDFKPLADMTPVRDFFVDNVAGDLDATLAVANDPNGGTYPVGSVIQLVPFEAMVKRAPGFDPASNDWEFLVLDVSEDGTEIVSRGGSDVVSEFSGTACVGCHSAAEPQFDFVCEDDHGCEPLPFEDDVIRSVQESDPRPSR